MKTNAAKKPVQRETMATSGVARGPFRIAAASARTVVSWDAFDSSPKQQDKEMCELISTATLVRASRPAVVVQYAKIAPITPRASAEPAVRLIGFASDRKHIPLDLDEFQK
jgi:hypothetical protein